MISLPGSGVPDPDLLQSIEAALGAKGIPGVSSSLPPCGTLPLQKCFFKALCFCAGPQEPRVSWQAWVPGSLAGPGKQVVVAGGATCEMCCCPQPSPWGWCPIPQTQQPRRGEAEPPPGSLAMPCSRGWFPMGNNVGVCSVWQCQKLIRTLSRPNSCAVSGAQIIFLCACIQL